MDNKTLTKEEVFAIMGKYYGNAHYRGAWSAADLVRITQVLDEVNALGYHFSNLNRLSDHEDSRFLPIIFDNYGKFENPNVNIGLLSSICHRGYHACTPRLLSLYAQEQDADVRFRISNCLFHIRNRKYIPEYLRVVSEEGYGKSYDMIMDILCKFHVSEALPILISLYRRNPDEWTFAFLRLGKLFHDASVIPYLEELTEHENGEYRSMAKKALMNKSLTGDEG